MDEDELQELRRDVVQTGKGYDTFGHAAAEQNRKANLSEQAQRPGLAALDLSNIIAPVPESLGRSFISSRFLMLWKLHQFNTFSPDFGAHSLCLGLLNKAF